jgi:hypothetical protein
MIKVGRPHLVACARAIRISLIGQLNQPLKHALRIEEAVVAVRMLQDIADAVIDRAKDIHEFSGRRSNLKAMISIPCGADDTTGQ